MAQSLANVLVHMIWSVKDRRSLIQDDLRAALHGYMAGILKHLESAAVIINSVPDHVHILNQLAKTIALCKVIEEVKKSSSKWMKAHGIADFAWQGGYGAFSVANPMRIRFANTSKIRRSIRRNWISRKNSAGSASGTTCRSMSVMCGSEFVAPLQGLNLYVGGGRTQGLAPGCHVLRLRRGPMGDESWTPFRGDQMVVLRG